MQVSEDTNVRYVTRNSYRDRKPIGYVTKEQAVDERNFQKLKYIDSRQEYVVQRHPKRDARCQMTTKYVIQQPTTCDVGCQTTTTYVLLLPPRPSVSWKSSSTHSSTTSSKHSSTTSSTHRLTISSNHSSTQSTTPTPNPPTPLTLTPPPLSNTKDKLVYCIDLRPHVEILEPKPFDVFERRIVLQPKKKIDDYIVTVGGGWNKMNDYMERHEPVKKFVYEREHLKNSNLPEKKKKYYGFKSIYKSPRYNRAHCIL
ncbi:unnamed protein product [Mytilus coruscus]|uniref:GAR domain-containing protein n=1 Tax=Mytilus coruscus TaxID=42192 RepID=A0A6J8ESL1_MYTCO|nr:unnamed protein product [Mytilus coruscus]